ncbi:MAG: glutaredoxin family protein [Nocardioides sp.]
MSSSTSPQVSRGPRVTLYSRPGCHLCEQAEQVIAELCAELGESYVTVMIDDDPALRARFSDEVPVTFVDGRQHDFWRVDPLRLRAALSG